MSTLSATSNGIAALSSMYDRTSGPFSSLSSLLFNGITNGSASNSLGSINRGLKFGSNQSTLGRYLARTDRSNLNLSQEVENSAMPLSLVSKLSSGESNAAYHPYHQHLQSEQLNSRNRTVIVSPYKTNIKGNPLFCMSVIIIVLK